MYTSRRDFLTRAFTRAAASTAAQQDEPGLTDEEIAAFVESAELVLVEAYNAATASGKLAPGTAQALTPFAGHHREHAGAMAQLAGGEATGRAHPKLLDIVSGQLQDAPDEKAVLQVLFDLEDAAASTHLYVLGAAKDTTMRRRSASILPAEAQHAVVVGRLQDAPLSNMIPATGFENQDRALDPTKFPLSTTTTASE